MQHVILISHKGRVFKQPRFPKGRKLPNVRDISKVARNNDGFKGFGSTDYFSQTSDDQVNQGESNVIEAENNNEDGKLDDGYVNSADLGLVRMFSDRFSAHFLEYLDFVT